MKIRTQRRLLAKKIQTSRIGSRCSGFAPGCLVCAGYHFYELYKRFPSSSDEWFEHCNKLERLASEGIIQGVSK